MTIREKLTAAANLADIPATVKQIAYLASLWAKAEFTDEDAEQPLTKKRASFLIDRALNPASIMETRPEKRDNSAMPPFRVCWTRYTNQPGCFGWATRTAAYQTEETALEAAKAPMVATVYMVEVDRFDYAADKWVTIYKRDRRNKKK